MITLRKMTESEFAVFAKWSVENYAGELVRSGVADAGDAFRESEKEFREMLPDGLRSKENYLCVIQTGSGEDAGLIWFQTHRDKPDVAFVAEFLIREGFRRRGYGAEALELVARDAREKGYQKMSLSVFKYNTAARALYEKAGFSVVEEYPGNLIMEKALTGILDIKRVLDREDVLRVLAASVYRPTPERLAERVRGYMEDEDISACGYMMRRGIAGVAVFCARGEGEVVLRDIAVAEELRGQGIGKALVRHVADAFPDKAILAETDDDAVGFYRRLGFSVTPLGEKYGPGTARYLCALREETKCGC